MVSVSLELLSLDGLRAEAARLLGLLGGTLSSSSPRTKGLLVAGVVALLVRSYRGWRRLSHVPGPFLWSLSSLPLLRANLVGRSHQILNDLTNEHGR